MNRLLLCLAMSMCFQLPALAQVPERVVRVTTGYHQAAGWEKPLVDGNPNLGHYHWTPIGGYDQGYLHIKMPQRPQGSVYTKPVHLSPDAFVPKITERPQPLAKNVNTPHSESTLAGEILPQKRTTAMQAQPAKVARYEDLDTKATLVNRPTKLEYFSSRENVSGLLLSRGRKVKPSNI